MIPATIFEKCEDFGGTPAGSVLPVWRKDAVSGLMVRCPGCGVIGFLAVRPYQRSGQPSWVMSGFPDAVTLMPSVNFTGCCHWHGWLRDGQWV